MSIFANAPRPREKEGEEESSSFLGRALELLGRPSKSVAGFVRGIQDGEDPLARAKRNFLGEQEDDFEGVLAREGMEEGFGRSALGFVGDVVLDPLNLAGAPIAKAAGLGLKGAGKLATKLPAAKLLKEKFVPLSGLDEIIGKSGGSYQDMRRLHNSRLNSESAEANDAISKLLEDTKLAGKPQVRDEVSFALDKGEMLTGQAEDLRKGVKSLFDEQWEKEVGAGLQDPAAKIDNYVTYMLNNAPEKGARARALSGKLKFKDRNIQSLDDAAKLGAETDIARIAATRLGAGKRALANNEFFQRVAEEFGQAAPGAGFREVSFAADEALAPALKGIHVPEGVAQDIEKIVNFESAGGDEFLKGFQKYLAAWKTYATKTNPGFHVRNLVGNAFNSWLGGMNPMTILPKTILAGARQTPSIGKYASGQIDDAMRKYGVIGSGHTGFTELNAMLDPAQKSWMLNNPIVNKGQAIGNTVEEASRKALFFDQLEKGKSLEEAALHVRKYLFDYSELTDFEKGLRNWAFPFYTWTRKNMPLQLEALITQPGKVSTVGNVFEEVEKEVDRKGLTAKGRPDYMKEGEWLQLPFESTTGGSMFGKPSLPLADLNRLEQPFKELLNMVGPQKLPIEIALNKKTFTNTPITNENDPDAPVKASDVLGLLAVTQPELAKKLGIYIDKKGKAQTTHPIADHLLTSLVPISSVAGKGFSNPNELLGGDFGAFGGSIKPEILSMLGLTTKALSTQEQKEILKRQRAERKTKATNQKKVRKLDEQ